MHAWKKNKICREVCIHAADVFYAGRALKTWNLGAIEVLNGGGKKTDNMVGDMEGEISEIYYDGRHRAYTDWSIDVIYSFSFLV